MLLVPLLPLYPFVPSGVPVLFDLKLVVRLRRSLKKGMDGHSVIGELESYSLVLSMHRGSTISVKLTRLLGAL